MRNLILRERILAKHIWKDSKCPDELESFRSLTKVIRIFVSNTGIFDLHSVVALEYVGLPWLDI